MKSRGKKRAPRGKRRESCKATQMAQPQSTVERSHQVLSKNYPKRQGGKIGKPQGERADTKNTGKNTRR